MEFWKGSEEPWKSKTVWTAFLFAVVTAYQFFTGDASLGQALTQWFASASVYGFRDALNK